MKPDPSSWDFSISVSTLCAKETESLSFIYNMAKVGKALAVSFGALAGGAAGFYFLEMYKIKSKVNINE